MPRSSVSDPIRNFKFQVKIIPTPSSRLASYLNGISDLGFAAMSGLTVQHSVVGYREGGMNTHTHKLVGQSDFTAITFSRGVIANQAQLWRWSEFLHSWNQASLSSDSNVDFGNDYRCDIFVQVFDHPHAAGSYQEPGNSPGTVGNYPLGKARLGLKLFNCWPGAYTLTDLSAGDSGILVQQLTVHHEGFKLGWTAEEIESLKTGN
jgi:phage tail-like protein